MRYKVPLFGLGPFEQTATTNLWIACVDRLLSSLHILCFLLKCRPFFPPPPSDYTNWEAKVELILSALLVKAVAHCLRSAEMSLHPASRAYSHSVYLLLCLKYIILLLLLPEKLLCPCSLPLPRPGVWKLNIAFKSQFPQWDYANQPLPVSPLSFYSCLIYPPPPWCISSFAVVYSIHLRPSFSSPNGPNHVFPFCVAVLPLASVCVCTCACVSAYTNVLSRPLLTQKNKKIKPPPLQKKKSFIPLKRNAVSQCHLTIRSVSYLFISLSSHP